jgi:hypothetical protein
MAVKANVNIKMFACRLALQLALCNFCFNFSKFCKVNFFFASLIKLYFYLFKFYSSVNSFL